MTWPPGTRRAATPNEPGCDGDKHDPVDPLTRNEPQEDNPKRNRRDQERCQSGRDARLAQEEERKGGEECQEADAGGGDDLAAANDQAASVPHEEQQKPKERSGEQEPRTRRRQGRHFVDDD